MLHIIRDPFLFFLVAVTVALWSLRVTPSVWGPGTNTILFCIFHRQNHWFAWRANHWHLVMGDTVFFRSLWQLLPLVLTGNYFSPPFLQRTPSFPSQTLERLVELTRRHSRALDYPSGLLQALGGTEVQRQHFGQMTHTLIVCLLKTHRCFRFSANLGEGR